MPAHIPFWWHHNTKWMCTCVCVRARVFLVSRLVWFRLCRCDKQKIGVQQNIRDGGEPCISFYCRFIYPSSVSLLLLHFHLKNLRAARGCTILNFCEAAWKYRNWSRIFMYIMCTTQPPRSLPPFLFTFRYLVWDCVYRRLDEGRNHSPPHPCMLVSCFNTHTHVSKRKNAFWNKTGKLAHF